MTRVRVSTTVDHELLSKARALREGSSDAALLDEALAAMLRQHRAAEIDSAYEAAYARQPVGVPDAWGDLESWSDAAGRS